VKLSLCDAESRDNSARSVTGSVLDDTRALLQNTPSGVSQVFSENFY
jgi:hypothetical protein